MPLRKTSTTSDLEDFKKHQLYSNGVSSGRIVTRSQTGIIQIKRTPSDNELMIDKTRFQPPGHPHLLITLKGLYGAIPSTIITRSTENNIEITPELQKKINKYKEFKPPKK
ncbi:hypothetical protein JTE90_018773 [Oedothorax gibbosus]|uniref:Uncharacterized protein n=1 Tax=Oedothorax gibbosus TaxID=931172 RepID=A0AAV6UUE9_9ARAC|nr:hypothetical protein JTE90_018773 [Oedothorax gibbosus]